MQLKRYSIKLLVIASIACLVHSCANIGMPSGGDFDFDPPVMIRSTPSPNQTNVKTRKVEIIFDENVQIEKPNEKVIITPPQINMPVIRAQNNRVFVELKDTLLENTTYTIDFTDAISDNNEKNVLENFSLSFSTGDVVDSLAVSGKVLAADNLEPISGMYVGIHSNLSDTAFTSLPFLRISRTNELGNFTIRGIAEGEYKIYALDDINRDYKYDDPAESIAFLGSIIVPSSEPAIRQDSVYIRALKKDTVVDVAYTRFMPDDIMLRSFKSSFKRQYLQKYERPEDDVLSIYFGAPTAMPTIESLSVNEDINQWAVLERSANNDSLKFWITNPYVADIDTISLEMTYFVTDTLNNQQLATDTLKFANRKKRQENTKKDKKKDEKEETRFMTINTSVKPIWDLYNDIELEFEYPILDSITEKISVQHQVDSVFTDVTFKIVQDSLNPRKYLLSHKWIPGDSYRLIADSASIYAYNGLWNDKLEAPFKIKTLDKYGNLYINIQSLPEGMPAFVELLDKSDKPKKKAIVKDGGVLFMNLDPNEYYARIVLDRNDNHKWDTGDYFAGLEPEIVYYYPKSFDIKENWDLEEDWDITAVPLDKQKPLEITKNKPKGEESKRKQLERKEAQEQKNRERQNNSNNNFNNRGTNYNNQSNNNMF